MRRKIVQHGPSTLTISLPNKWAKEYCFEKGDEVIMEKTQKGLIIMTEKRKKESTHNSRILDLKGASENISLMLSSVYGAGCDYATLEYSDDTDLATIYDFLREYNMGLEVVEEEKNRVRIRQVSELIPEEFNILFRRVFYFLIHLVQEGEHAIRQDEQGINSKLMSYQQNISKLTDYCRRVVNKYGQRNYQNEGALYHTIEQLESISRQYAKLYALFDDKTASSSLVEAYQKVLSLLQSFNKVFFNYSHTRIHDFVKEHSRITEALHTYRDGEEMRQFCTLINIADEVFALIKPTVMLNL